MADNLETLRRLSIAHILAGILLVCLGIADRFEGFIWTGDLYFGLWTGTWTCITGTLGMYASLRETAFSRKAFIGVLLFFCIISVLLGLTLVVIYGFFILFFWNVALYIPVQIAIASMFATLGITETVTGIWSAVCCCGSCCAETPSELEQQFLNPTTDAESSSTGEFMRQGVGNVATIIPVQGDNSCDEWGGLLPEIQEPTYGATENHPRPVGAPLSVPLQAVGVGEIIVQASESGARGGWR